MFRNHSNSALGSLLRRVNPEKTANTGRTLDLIRDEFRLCKQNTSSLRRFKISVGTGELEFNHTVQVDTMFISHRPVLHMVELATDFTAENSR